MNGFYLTVVFCLTLTVYTIFFVLQLKTLQGQILKTVGGGKKIADYQIDYKKKFSTQQKMK